MVWEALGEYHGPPVIHAYVMYMEAREYDRTIERSYRAYVTGTLRLIPQGGYYTTEWHDMIESAKRNEPERTAEEIVDDVIGRLGR